MVPAPKWKRSSELMKIFSSSSGRSEDQRGTVEVRPADPRINTLPPLESSEWLNVGVGNRHPAGQPSQIPLSADKHGSFQSCASVLAKAAPPPIRRVGRRRGPRVGFPERHHRSLPRLLAQPARGSGHSGAGRDSRNLLNSLDQETAQGSHAAP